jgi:hypothetical protein
VKWIRTVAGGVAAVAAGLGCMYSMARPAGPATIRFRDVAASAGVKFSLLDGATPEKRQIEPMAGGVAVFDFNNDDRPDIYFVNGARQPLLTKPDPSYYNRLYRNEGNGTFTDVTDAAGVRGMGFASGVAAGDYDNNGFVDLFIAGVDRNILYRNRGNGTFEDATAPAGLAAPPGAPKPWAIGAGWFDYDNDGRLDLIVVHYCVWNPEKEPACTIGKARTYCHPKYYQGLPNALFRNNGDGTFTDVSRQSGVAAAAGAYPMTAVSADYDNDGWPDIYVACDSTPSWLFRNQHDGTFRQEGLERGAALSEDGMEQAGMGVAVGDYDLDGHLDIFKTHFADDTNVLYRNDGKGNFDDVTIRAGIGVETRYVGWGAGMADLDNDGFPDIFLVTGSVYPEVERALPAYPFRTPRLVFRNLGDGRFEELIEEAGSGVAAAHASRGCAFGDFDNDGDVDVLIMNMNEPPSLLRNDVSGSGHWLKVLLVGVKSNRSAIGARVVASSGGRTRTQEVSAQSSFYSVNDRRLHFGLGEAKLADLTIRWPNGLTEKIPNVEANQLVVIREGAGIERRQKFEAR